MNSVAVRGDVSQAEPNQLGDTFVTSAITSVHIVASVDGKPASDAAAYARADQTVTLYAVVRAGSTYYSDAPSPRIAGKRVAVQPIERAPAFSLGWSRLEPAVACL
jgi:hypothetical protein